MLVGIAFVVLGAVLVVGARVVAGLLNDMHADQVSHSSFLSQEQIDRRREIYLSAQNRRIETWIVRSIGVLVAAGGVAAIVHSM